MASEWSIIGGVIIDT
ncbi:unnamed protein product, partial [Rotaria sordida]